MPILELPIYNFDNLTPVTMTIIIPYDVEELNLPAIFTLLPVTTQVLPAGCTLQKKQGKIRLPAQLNVPGVILSMRYDHQVRGIVRSEHAKSFSHTIIIDIGTSSRIISAKLSRASIELTGPTSYEVAYEAANYVLQHVKVCQDNLNLIQDNPELALKMRDRLLHELTTHQDTPGSPVSTQPVPIDDWEAENDVQTEAEAEAEAEADAEEEDDDWDNDLRQPSTDIQPWGAPEEEEETEDLAITGAIEQQHSDDMTVEQRIYDFFKENSRGYSLGMIPEFLDFLMGFDKKIYTGSLQLGKLECQMVNLLFNIGFPINQVAFTEVMNREPFEASYTNLKRTPNVIVVHKYIKSDNSKKQHTIRVNRSGHVKYSGPNLESMRYLYYAFVQRIIKYETRIRSAEQMKQKIKLGGRFMIYSADMLRQMLAEEKELRRYVLENSWDNPPHTAPAAATTTHDGKESASMTQEYEGQTEFDTTTQHIAEADNSNLDDIVATETIDYAEFNYEPLLGNRGIMVPLQ